MITRRTLNQGSVKLVCMVITLRCADVAVILHQKVKVADV